MLTRPGLDRTRLYVAMTRGRQTNQVYLASESDTEIQPRDWQRQPMDPREQLARMLTTAGELAGAHTRQPEPPVLPKTAPEPGPQAPAPAREPTREPEPYRFLHQRAKPYRELSR